MPQKTIEYSTRGRKRTRLTTSIEDTDDINKKIEQKRVSDQKEELKRLSDQKEELKQLTDQKKESRPPSYIKDTDVMKSIVPIVSPRSHRIINHPNKSAQNHILRDAIRHLDRCDERFGKLAKMFECFPFTLEGKYIGI